MGIGLMKNPLERSNFISLDRTVEDIAVFDGNVIKRLVYFYRYIDYRMGEVRSGVWTLITILSKSDRLEKLGKENGLLKIDNTLVCVSCMTSEYVKSESKLNDGQMICKRCGTHDRGWE